jgi:glycosyltransferase involved in cell wall biosynthesis
MDFGGAQMLLLALAQRLPKECFQMSVCVLQPFLALADRLESMGVDVYPLNRVRPSIQNPVAFSKYILENILDIIRICRNRHVDVLHTHLSDSEILGVAAGKCFGVKKIMTTNHYPFLPSGRRRLDPRNHLRKQLYRMLYNQGFDFTIAVSDDIREKLVGYYHIRPEKIRVITNGINLAEFDGQHSSEVKPMYVGAETTAALLTTIGRLSAQKGHSYLIRAVRLLLDRDVPVHLLIVGEGELKDSLRNLSMDLGISDRVHFLGGRHDISHILGATDIFVFPSLWEGTSLALLEAMASQKTILATAEPGNMAVIQHGINGFLVPPGDPASLADGAATLLADPARSRELAGNARKTVLDKYNIEYTVQEYSKIWSA